MATPASGTVEPLVWGAIGGLLGHLLILLNHAKLSKEDRTLAVVDSWFWIGWFIEALLAVIVTLLYLRSGISLPPLLAINVGASAPLIVQRLISSVPAIGKTS